MDKCLFPIAWLAACPYHERVPAGRTTRAVTMSKLSAKHQKIVAGEIARWQQDGMIEEDLAVKLTSLYPLHSARVNVSQALSVVGAVLVGLGAILFMAAN
ncbi:MAG TPA: DUF2157 domain-containing protein, partial [Candidatus Obscuribacterales bacterium]|nr:DUF2157 domain-containing protein [Candidatus Obscuribacterales bacterium]